MPQARPTTRPHPLAARAGRPGAPPDVAAAANPEHPATAVVELPPTGTPDADGPR